MRVEVFPIDGERWFLVRREGGGASAGLGQLPELLGSAVKDTEGTKRTKRTLGMERGAEYALRKGLGCWDLWFEGQHAVVRHEQGIFYVAWLLMHPGETIHALDLAAKIPEIYRKQLGLAAIVEGTAESASSLPSHARLQERSLALDDAEAMRALLRKEKELEAVLEDESESEPVKQEALRELEAIAQFQREHGRRSKDSARRAADAVRRAIRRLHQRLDSALDRDGSPHTVLRPFAAHLREHLIIPSARYCGPAAKRARGPLAGCFTYESPAGVVWTE
jgi:hypothetical protein